MLRPPNNRQAQGHHVTDEQCIHIPANMFTHCMRNNEMKLSFSLHPEDVTAMISLRVQLKHNNCNFSGA